MASFQEVDRLIRKIYPEIAAEWYAKRPQYRLATLKFDMDCTQDAYGRWTNELIVSICDANLEDADILNADEWPVWKRSLIHEMLHEFDRKEVVEANDVGRELYRKFGNRWGGPGHDERFYTAIADRASYFELTADELVQRI